MDESRGEDTETGEQKRQRVAENLRRLKAAQRPREEIDEYLASEREDPSFTRDASDLAGGLAQTAADAASFGLVGLGEDAATALAGTGDYGTRFRLNRDLRQENKRAVADLLPPVQIPGSPLSLRPATMARLAGTALNPVGRLTKAPAEAAGFLRSAANLGREGALQGLLQGAGEHAGTSEDPTGLRHGGQGAVVGGTMGAVAGGLGAGIRYAGNIRRDLANAATAKNLGDRAHSIDDAVERLDNYNYGKAEREAVVTPEIRAVLARDPKAKEIAAEIRADAEYQGVPMDDAQVLMAAYRRLSTQQRRAEATLRRSESGDVGYDPKLSEGTVQNIKTTKGRLLSAAEAPTEEGYAGIPSLRPAIISKAKSEGAREAFERGAEMADRIALGKNVKPGKLLQNSPAAWEREIADYSLPEARRALQGVRGYTKEIPELSAQPLTTFNVVPSVVRTGLALKRLRPFVAQLEAKAGQTRQPNALSAILDHLIQAGGRYGGGQP